MRYFLCDAVLNFAVFRTAIFAAGAQWDERFKSNGEHEDFYLNLKVNTPFKVGYLPTMVAYHHHPEAYRVYRSRLRERNEGWKLFLEKWGLEQHIEYGLGVRTVDDIATVTAVEDVRERFFVNADLSLRRTEARPGTLLIGDFEKVSAVGALTPAGARAECALAPGRLLVNPGSATIVPATPRLPELSPEGAPSEAELYDRYGLESSWQSQAVSFVSEQLYFRYDPVLRSDNDFFVWYFCVAPKRRDESNYRRLAVIARWSASDGSDLVWRSRRMFIDLRPSEFWRPLFLEVPVVARGCRWLRFDLITDGGSSPDPVCTGFLFGRQSNSARAENTQDASEVLALGRLPNDGASPGTAGRSLEDIAPTCAKWPVTPLHSAMAAEMSILQTDKLAGLEVLYFVGWESLGRALVSARLPAPDLPVPTALALPKAGWSSLGGRVFGYGSTAGLVTLSW